MNVLSRARARVPARTVLGVALLAALATAHARAAWEPNGVRVVPWEGVNPSLLGDGLGGALLAWDSQGSIRTARVGSDGSVSAGLPGGGTELVASPYDQRMPMLIPDGAGGAYIVWADERWAQCTAHCQGLPLEIYALRLLADGSVAQGWPAGGLNVGAPPLDPYTAPQACTDGEGGLIVAWSEPAAGDGGNIRARRFTPDGQSMWGSAPTDVCTQGARQLSARLAPDGSGGAVIVWQDWRNGFGAPTLYASRVTGAGAKPWGAQGVPLNTTPYAAAGPPQLVADAAGGTFMLWSEDGLATSLAHLRTAGGVDWSLALGSAAAIGDAVIVADGAGGVLAAWSLDVSGSASRDLHVLHLLADETLPPAWTGPEVVCDAAGAQLDPRIASDGSGGAYLFWRDDRSGGIEMFATRLDATGNPAPAWPANGQLVCSAPGTRAVQALAPDGTGGAIALWMDQRDIPTEVLYAERFLPGGVLDAPAPGMSSFSLLGAGENPARGSIVARFRLPDAAPARLQLFDVTGRAIATRDVGGLGTGMHTLGLGGAAPAPGVYVLRLVRGGEAQARRVVLVR